MPLGEFCLLELSNSGVGQHAELHILTHAHIYVVRSPIVPFALEYVGDPETSTTMHSREVEHAVFFFLRQGPHPTPPNEVCSYRLAFGLADASEIVHKITMSSELTQL